MPMSFFSISEVYPPKLKTEEKRLHLTLNAVDLYNRAIQDSGLLVPDGGLYLVDLHHLTQGARPKQSRRSCTFCSIPQLALSEVSHAHASLAFLFRRADFLASCHLLHHTWKRYLMLCRVRAVLHT